MMRDVGSEKQDLESERLDDTATHTIQN